MWHGGLLSKLKAIGIRGRLLRWFGDYLSRRTQAVVIKGEKSDFREVSAGVPQGSVLGPLLFLVYINDIVTNIMSVIRLFADDTSLSSALENSDTRTETLNRDLNTINNWAKRWKMNFNVDKTEVVNYGRERNNGQQVVFDDADLSESDSHKHLGLILQFNGKWEEYINYIANKTNVLISCLCREIAFHHICE